MTISEKKMQIVIDNYFKSECDVNTSIRQAFEKGFRIGIKKLPSAQPELARINDCNGCKFIGCYDTDFPCANCVRKDKDYYEPEG